MVQTTKQVMKGIDTNALNGIIDAVKQTPAIARATFAVEGTTEAGFNTRSRARAPALSRGSARSGARRGTPAERVRADVTGYIDLQGFLGLPTPGAVRPGYERIHAKFTVKSRASRADLEKLKET